MLALMNSHSQSFLAQQNFTPLPQIEALEPASLPSRRPEQVAPKLLENPATAILAMDLDSGKMLLARHPDRAQPVASLSKLMTAHLILEHHKLNEVVMVPIEATQINSSTIDVYEHEQIRVQTLLEAMLIGSANDAALALAIYHSGSEKEFVQEMNAEAQKLGFSSAEFFNATGLDEAVGEKGEAKVLSEAFVTTGMENVRGNKMSPRDIVGLTRLLLKNHFFRETVARDHFYGTSVDEKFFHEKPSTNQLLGTFLNLKGVKTGFTYLAGECFVALGESPNGHEILTVILGSSDRFGETKTLLSWIYDSFEWR